MSSARTDIGRVRSVNPAKREARVEPRPGFSGALNGRNEVEFELQGGKRAKFAVQTVEEQHRYVKLTLAEGTSTDDVASLRGAKVFADAQAAKPTNPFAMNAAEFVGFVVADLAGNAVGTVAGGFNTPAHGVIEIARDGASSLLAPFVPEVVANIDLVARRIVVRNTEDHMVENDTGGTMA
jgi:ribosomal 30S subunit maturation factor RimM